MFRALFLLGAATAIDTIGSTGCTANACVFANSNLRFGSGAETSVNEYGLFVQPWYWSNVGTQWYKLTFNTYPLDTAVGLGTGGASWSGTNIFDVYGLSPTNTVTDYSGFIVDSADSLKSVGHGIIVARRTFSLQGQQVSFVNTFSLGLSDSFVKVTNNVTNLDVNTIQNLIIWVGTRDDYVGSTDSNTKTRGNLVNGAFVAISSPGQSSRAIMVSNTNEGVLFYSETEGVMTAFSTCCSFSNAYNINPLTLAPQTPTPTDGSYAAVLPIGNLQPGASASITWYYAAGTIQSLASVAQSVAVAQAADAGIVLSSVTGSSSASYAPQPVTSGSSSVSASMTASAPVTPSSISSAVSVASMRPMWSRRRTGSPVSSASASGSASNMMSLSASGSASLTANGTFDAVPSFSSHFSITSVASNPYTHSLVRTTSTSPRVSPSSTASAIGSDSATSSRTPSQTPDPTLRVIHDIVIMNTTYEFRTVYVNTEKDPLVYLYVTLIMGAFAAATCLVMYLRKRPVEKNEVVDLLQTVALKINAVNPVVDASGAPINEKKEVKKAWDKKPENKIEKTVPPSK